MYNYLSCLRCLGQDWNKKFPITECLVCCGCVLFSIEESMLRMGSCARFCCLNILFVPTMCRNSSLRSVLLNFIAIEKFPW